MYCRPRTLDEAVHALSASGGQILSGGTDFFPAIVDRAVPSDVVDISRVQEIKGIAFERDFIRIGGATSWSEVIAAALPRCLDGLKSAAREVGSIQIQNRGTVAGNICNASPAADGVPPLLALDAEVELVSAEGARRIPIADFILGNRKTARRPDEILANIFIARQLADASSAFLKLGARRYLVISISMVAAVIKTNAAGIVEDARIAVGSCSAKAQRLGELERVLIGLPAGRSLREIVSPHHLASLAPIDDVRATSAYRLDASLTLIRRTLDLCARIPPGNA